MAKLRFKMGSIQEVRRTLVRVCNMVANDEMDSKRANSIILACNAVLSSIRVDEQQRKINELEQLLEGAENDE